jgi:hypothetical protein
MESLLDTDTWMRTLALCGYLLLAGFSAFIVSRAVGRINPFGLYMLALVGPFALLIFAPILQTFVGHDYFLPMALSIVILNVITMSFTKRAREERRPAVTALEALDRSRFVLLRLLDEELTRSKPLNHKELQLIKDTLVELRQKDIDALK